MRFTGWLSEAATAIACFCSLLNAGEPATAVANVTAGFVTAIAVTSGGSESLPELTIKGPTGSWSRVESATNVNGPWTTWTNMMVGPEGAVLVDLSPDASTRFYRSVESRDPAAPIGPAGFVWISPGTFTMGSPADEAWRRNDEVQHTVTLTQGFWFSDHEVTQNEYQAVMGSNPSYWNGESLPVEQVSWNDAVAYCQKLTEKERAAGRITAQHAYRLPTEAEWEYAARAGTTGARYGQLDTIAWYELNSGKQTHPVKQKAANAWGLHDMLGNVFEWCSDWSGDYPTRSVTDPMGPSSGSLRVARGGSWLRLVGGARSAGRGWGVPNIGYNYQGFRPVLSSVR
jgi:formylglycine-generating enzyme required for sulfatase activity